MSSDAWTNPFRYGEPVPPEELLDRDEEARLLLENAFGGHNSRLAAPRRYGKTSLLARVVEEARAAGWAAVYVDFFGVLTLDDIAKRIELAYVDELRGPLAKWFANVRRMLRPTVQLGGGPLPAGVEVTSDPQAEPPLLERLALPARIYKKHGTRTLVIFDEFQDILATRDRADAVMRSEIQHHGDAASYVFAGSHVGMMRDLFADKRRAFYGQASPLELPPLRYDDVGEYVADRFEATGRSVGSALDPLLMTTEGHPQRAMLMAHILWDLTPPETEATEATWLNAYDRAMLQLHDELRGLWAALPTYQRRVLAAVADGSERVYAASRRHGGSRGAAPGRAIQALLDRGEIVADKRTEPGYRLVDPMLAAWVKQGRPGT